MVIDPGLIVFGIQAVIRLGREAKASVEQFERDVQSLFPTPLPIDFNNLDLVVRVFANNDANSVLVDKTANGPLARSGTPTTSAPIRGSPALPRCSSSRRCASAASRPRGTGSSCRRTAKPWPGPSLCSNGPRARRPSVRSPAWFRHRRHRPRVRRHARLGARHRRQRRKAGVGDRTESRRPHPRRRRPTRDEDGPRRAPARRLPARRSQRHRRSARSRHRQGAPARAGDAHAAADRAVAAGRPRAPDHLGAHRQCPPWSRGERGAADDRHQPGGVPRTRFDAEKAIGALTGALLREASARTLQDNFTEAGFIALFRSALGVAATRPQFFIGRAADDAKLAKLAGDLIGGVADTLRDAPVPFNGDLGAQLAGLALESLARNAGAFLDPHQPWEATAAALAKQVAQSLDGVGQPNVRVLAGPTARLGPHLLHPGGTPPGDGRGR